MATSSEWSVEPREPSWLGRLIAPQSGGRPSTVAFILGALSAAAFVGSLALDWQSVTIPTGNGDGPGVGDMRSSDGIATLETLSLVYTLGVVALLGVVGAVVTQPVLALRLRMAAAGATVGLLGVLTAATLRLGDTMAGFPTFFFINPTERERVTYAYEPGIFCGYAAVLLAAVAIWHAGRAARSGEADKRSRASGRHGDAQSRPKHELEVSFSDGLDLSVGPGETLLR